MHTSLISKIASPLHPPTIVHREVLVGKLHDILGNPSGGDKTFSSYKLILLLAPAGYGKTTLLVDFAQHTSIACCWYFLDHADKDKVTFFTTLLASIRQRFPSFGTKLDTLVSNVFSEDSYPAKDIDQLDTLVNSLAGALATEIKERLLICLCHYHEVNESKTINYFVNRLIQQLPPQCVLCIESWAVPEIDVAALITQRKLFGLGKGMLRFTAHELQELAIAQGRMPLSDAEAEHLATSFDGWITGILLGTRLGDVHALDSFAITNTDYLSGVVIPAERKKLFTYLVADIFKHEPALYTFLQQTAILQQMLPSVCDELLDISDTIELLQALERQGLFVSHSSEGEYHYYTCHPVLREFLYESLREQSPGRFAELHRRASELFSARQDYHLAIYHALEASATDLAERFILKVLAQMFAQGHTEMLVSWIDALLKLTADLHPQLLLMRARLYLMMGNYSRALPLLDMTSRSLADPSSTLKTTEQSRLQAEITILRSKALFQRGDYHQARTLCQHALADLPADEIPARAEAYTRLGVCYNLLGDFPAGIAQLQKALHLLGWPAENSQTADLHSTLASTYSLVGNFALAEHHLKRATLYWNQANDEWRKVDNLIRMGLIRQRQGAFSEAAEEFMRALTICRGKARYQRGEAYTLISLGELYLDQECYQQALTFLEDGLLLARLLEDRYLINCALCNLSIVYLFRGDHTTARLFAAEIDVPGEGEKQASYERVLRDLTLGTIHLYQHDYKDALACLSSVQTAAKAMGLWRELILSIMRIAACHLAKGETIPLRRRLDEVVTLTRQSDCRGLVIIELRHLPDLEQYIKASSDVAQLATLLLLKQASPGETREVPLPAPRLSPPSTSVDTGLSKLTIHAFGEPAVSINDTPITRWRIVRAMELFFYLLDCGRPVSKERIMTHLLPESQSNVEQALRATVYHLRRALGESCILLQGGSYMLNLVTLYGEHIWYDVAIFEEHFRRAGEALTAEDDITAEHEFTSMINLYRADYLQSFYNGRCKLRRDALQRTYLEARHQLALIYWRREQFDQSIVHWQHMLEIDSCMEEAHLGLMRCYLRKGKRGLSLRQYHRCKEILENELGVKPSPAIQTLYQRLQTH